MVNATELADDVNREFLRVPPRNREDARQESWLAAIENRCPRAAVITYWQNEKLHETREPTPQARKELPKEEKELDMDYAAKNWLDTVHGKAKQTNRHNSVVADPSVECPAEVEADTPGGAGEEDALHEHAA